MTQMIERAKKGDAEEYENRSPQDGTSGMEAQSDLEFHDLLAHLPKESRIIFQLYFGEHG